MRIGTITQLKAKEKIFPVVRDDVTIYFTLTAITEMEDYEKLSDEYTAKQKAKYPDKILSGSSKGDQVIPNPEFNLMEARLKGLTAYMVLKSIRKVTIQQGEQLEEVTLNWDTVNLEDLGTYDNFRKELQDFGLSTGEVQGLINEVTMINTLDDEAIDAAREAFLALNLRQQEQE